MKIKINFILAILLVFLVTGVSASMIIPANENALENAKAPDNSNVIEASDSGLFLKHVYILHFAKPESSIKPAKPSTATCYKTFSKWSIVPVSYTISTAVIDEVTAEGMKGAISASAKTWDASTSANLFNEAIVTSDTFTFGAYDGTNALMFGSYSNNGVIAVTSIWYTRGKLGQIYDSDILFNTYYTWGTTGNSNVMDLQNIATHELGHAVGLNDIYQSSCTDVTMYGYSNNGETSKRTLEQPDIIGLQKLYGA